LRKKCTNTDELRQSGSGNVGDNGEWIGKDWIGLEGAKRCTFGDQPKYSHHNTDSSEEQTEFLWGDGQVML
jgi:hypothetical protein